MMTMGENVGHRDFIKWQKCWLFFLDVIGISWSGERNELKVKKSCACRQSQRRTYEQIYKIYHLEMHSSPVTHIII